MFKKLLQSSWPYMLSSVIGLLLFVLKTFQGSWQSSLIWLAAASYWLVKLYKRYQLIKNSQK
ncbi:hypothetical protein MKL26_00195 [Streptococcus suis]|nr:hypothetical protein [Streptococcus suis]